MSPAIEERTQPDRPGLIAALGLESGPGIISVVGGGGKTSLLFELARLLPGRTVLTTTTRIFASQAREAALFCSLDQPGWQETVAGAPSGVLVAGTLEERHAVGVPASVPARLLALEGVDWVVVEADGSRRLPVKAPAEHEPVMPPETTLLVSMAGIDALSAPIAQIAHRPERVSALTGLPEAETLSPGALAKLLASDAGGGKAAPARARRVVLINKVESETTHALAAEVARGVLEQSGVERVLAGALRGDAALGWSVWPG